MTADRSGAAYRASADLLACRVLGALQGTENTAVVAAHLREAVSTPSSSPDPGWTAAALGAVRLLGADALAPSVLTGRGMDPEEAAAVRLCLSTSSPKARPPAVPPAGPERPWIRVWIDWGMVTLLRRLDSDISPVMPPTPGQPPQCADDASRRHSGDAGAGEGWVPWSLRMGRLASLALPGLDGPVHHVARSHALALARGATRAVLRRDFTTAARITRWLAWLAADGVEVPLDVVLLTRDIALRGGDAGRCMLDTAIARRLLDLEHV